MAIIKIELDTDYDKSIIFNIVRAFAQAAQPEVAEGNTGTDSPDASTATPLQEDVSVTGAAEKATEAAPAPEKKSRKKKEEIPSPEPVATQPVETEAVVEEAATVSPSSYTIDDVRAALQAFTQERSIEEGLALLKSFKAGRISELTESDYASFIEQAKV